MSPNRNKSIEFTCDASTCCRLRRNYYQAAATEYEPIMAEDLDIDPDRDSIDVLSDGGLAAAFMKLFPDCQVEKDPDADAYQPKVSTVLMLQAIVDAGRMTVDEYEAAEISLRIQIVGEGEKTAREIEKELLSKWSPYALALPHRVQLRNLKSRRDLNGTKGLAVSWVTEESRYEVRLDTGSIIAVRPENVQAVGDRKLL